MRYKEEHAGLNQLNDILYHYQVIANSDPTQLRLALPSKEIWRFFIDGEKQESGRELKLDTSFKPQPFYYRWFYFNPLEYSVKDYIEKIEKIKYINPADDEDGGGYIGSDFIGVLYKANWVLTEDEYSQFKLSDLLKMDKAWLPFERNEAGYLRAMGLGFNAIFNTHEPLTIDFIKQLHKLATDNVRHTGYDNERSQGISGEFRLLPKVHYGLGISNATEKGLLEFIRKIKNNYQGIEKDDLYLFKSLPGSGGFKLNGKCFTLIQSLSGKNDLHDAELHAVFKEFITVEDERLSERYMESFIPLIKKLISTTSESELASNLYLDVCDDHFWWSQESNQPDETNNNLNNQMQELLNRYQEDMISTDSQLCKLKIIIKYIQSCEQLHPFTDCNCRTFCMLFLNHLLIRNGLPLVILNNPNKFDMFSEDELLCEVLEGMSNTITLLQTGSLFHVSTDAILSDLGSKPCFASALTYFYDVVQAEEAERARSVNKLTI